MEKQKPRGMRIGESVFCIGYLVFVMTAGIIFLSRLRGADPAMRPEWMCCALMTLLLGGGDAFHLVPRILINIRGEASGSAGNFRAGRGCGRVCGRV